MPRHPILISVLLMSPLQMGAQTKPSEVQVEVVATATEYVPRSVTTTAPAHAYADCSGSTSYFSDFQSYGDSSLGSISGIAQTNTNCTTTSYPATESTYTLYKRVNYTIVKSERALFLLSCTQQGLFSRCTAPIVGTKYSLNLDTSSRKSSIWKHLSAGEGLLGGASGTTANLRSEGEKKEITLDLLNSVSLTAVEHTDHNSESPSSAQPTAKVHFTSTPSGGEIFVDNRFYGNTPSDVTLPVGAHTVRVTVGGKEWSRSIEITGGEITVHAQIPGRE
jgi:PEGA domain